MGNPHRVCFQFKDLTVLPFLFLKSTGMCIIKYCQKQMQHVAAVTVRAFMFLICILYAEFDEH